MNPLYVERVQQYFLTEFVRDNPLSNSTIISERTGRDKKLISIPAREEHMAKYWAIWKAILIAMVTMSTQRTFVPEITSEATKHATRNILDIERAYLVSTKPRYLDDVLEDCFKYIEDKQLAPRYHSDLAHLWLLQGLVSDLLSIENRYLARAITDISGNNQTPTMAMVGFQYNAISYNYDEIKELCESLRNTHDSISQLIREL